MPLWVMDPISRSTLLEQIRCRYSIASRCGDYSSRKDLGLRDCTGDVWVVVYVEIVVSGRITVQAVYKGIALARNEDFFAEFGVYGCIEMWWCYGENVARTNIWLFTRVIYCLGTLVQIQNNKTKTLQILGIIQ